MKRNYYLIALLMLLTFAFAACSNDDDSSAEETGESEADPAAESPAEEDVVRVWTYPVHGEYEGELEELVRQFEEENEHITIEYEVLSWAEGPQKFDIALNSGSPPDIYFGSPLGKYVSTELAVPIDDLVDVDLSHYNDVAIEGMKLEANYTAYRFICFYTYGAEINSYWRSTESIMKRFRQRAGRGMSSRNWRA